MVSPYTPAGYVSGACDATGYPNCPNLTAPYIHDFGSILGFTEWNFGMPFIDKKDKIYADYNAPDNNNPPGNVPLSDFFGSFRDFTSIQTSVPYTCFQYPSEEACFGHSWAPSDPDSY